MQFTYRSISIPCRDDRGGVHQRFVQPGGILPRNPADRQKQLLDFNLCYDIAVQGLTGTTLDYLAGGSFLKSDGDGTQEKLFDPAVKNGWTLANTNEDFRALNNENGFFMMCEGGKIDWSGHANDAATSIHETMAFADAVQAAVDFAAEHPNETLIIVTADHETGGMTIGFATTAYDTHFP